MAVLPKLQCALWLPSPLTTHEADTEPPHPFSSANLGDN